MSYLRMGRGRILFASSILFTVFVVHSLTVTFIPRSTPQPETPLALTQPVFAEPNTPSDELLGTANCRYGVSADFGETPWVSTVKAGWYINFGTGSSVIPGTEFVEFVNVHQNKNGTIYLPTFTINPPLSDPQLGALIDANPGHLWVIGNEIERVGQGDTYPEIYAIAYHDVYHYIKQRDPSAKVANAGLVQITPARLAYLDLVWDAYLETFGTPMPVDVWTIHVYILPEVRPDGVTPNGIANVPLGVNQPPNPPFSDWRRESGGDASSCALDEVYCFAEHTDMNTFHDQVLAMRQWLKNHGQKEKPLLISEFSVLYPYEVDPGGTCFLQDEYGNCFTPTRINTFMQEAFTYLEGSASVSEELGYSADNNRMVQQWLWYSMYSLGAGEVSNLLKPDFADFPAGSTSALSSIGTQFRSLVSSLPLNVNLFPYHYTFTQVNTDTIDIHVNVMNSGNTEVNGGFQISLYANPNYTGLIDSITMPRVRGCARDEIITTLRWSGLTPGSHAIYVKVDSTNQISETNEQDNFLTGFIILDPDHIYMPASRR